jgi:hypothetical protein
VPTGLIGSKESVIGGKAEIWLSGGVDGQVYDVVNRISTQAGRIDERILRLKVMLR